MQRKFSDEAANKYILLHKNRLFVRFELTSENPVLLIDDSDHIIHGRKIDSLIAEVRQCQKTHSQMKINLKFRFCCQSVLDLYEISRVSSKTVIGGSKLF